MAVFLILNDIYMLDTFLLEDTIANEILMGFLSKYDIFPVFDEDKIKKGT